MSDMPLEIYTGRMRVEKSVPREAYCPRCGKQMKPSSMTSSFRWFKCPDCGQTHRLWREFEWTTIKDQPHDCRGD